MSIHQKLVVIDISSIRIMTGAVSLDGSETVLGKGGKTLPTEVRASMGTKFFMDRSILKKLQGCRNRLVSYLGGVAIRYLSGYAAPITLRAEIEKKISEEKVIFEQIKQELLAHYDEYVEKWCDQFPECANELKASAPSLEKVEIRNKFAVNLFQVQPLEGEQAIAADSQAGDTLLEEVNRDARNLYYSSFRGKTECSRKAVSAIERLARKLQGLAFLDRRALPLAVDVFGRVGKLSKHGPYTGSDFTEVTNICLLLATKPDFNQEKALVDKAVATGTNFVLPAENSTNQEDSDTSAMQVVGGGKDAQDTEGKTTGKTGVKSEDNAQSATQVTDDQDSTLDLFNDLDSVGSSSTTSKAIPQPQQPQQQPATTDVTSKPADDSAHKTSVEDSANDDSDGDDYFSDQFA